MLVAKLIQYVVFGPLRVSERQVREQWIALVSLVLNNFMVCVTGVVFYRELLTLHNKF